MASHGKTLARTLCSGEVPNEFLQHNYKRMIKSKFRDSNTILNSTEYAITRKDHFSFLA